MIISDYLLWTVSPMSILFSKPSQCSLDLFLMYTSLDLKYGLLVQFSKSLIVWIWSDTFLHGKVWPKESINTLWSIFPDFLCLRKSIILSLVLGLLFLVFWLQTGAAVSILFLLYFFNKLLQVQLHQGPSKRRKNMKKVLALYSWNHSSIEGFLPQSFGSFGLLLPFITTAGLLADWKVRRWTKRGRRKGGISAFPEY